MGGSGGYAILAGSTTDTVNYTVLASMVVTTTSRKQELLVFCRCQFSHTVGSAEFDIGVRLYDDAVGTNSLSLSQSRFSVLPATAGKWQHYQWVGSFDLDFLSAAPGRHKVSVVAGPDTAGTLSWVQPQSNASAVVTLTSQGGVV
jgi:hypothetical protein